VPEMRRTIGAILASESLESNANAACKSLASPLLQAIMASHRCESKRISLGSIRDRPNSPKYRRTESVRTLPNCSLERDGEETILTKK